MKKKRIIVSILLILLIIITAWTVWENTTVGVTYYSIASERLPDAFDGYKIAVVSDLHNAQFGEENSQINEIITREAPDMIAITGDLIDSDRTDIDTAVKLVKKLTQIAPCYYVNGNHEARIGQRYNDLESRLTAENVEVLRNRAELLQINGQTVQIAGLDDPSFSDGEGKNEESVLRTNLRKMDLSEDFCILLSHRPEAIGAYADAEVDLALSGHAHGGQFRLPFIGGIYAPQQGFFPKYDAGVYTEDQTAMVVSRGLGNSRIPFRFNNRPEIVIIELNCK